jgi:hypothetical protein
MYLIRSPNKWTKTFVFSFQTGQQCTQIIYSCCKVLSSSCFDVIVMLLMLLLSIINYLKCFLCSMLLRYCCDVADALIKLVLRWCQSSMLLQNNCDVAHLLLSLINYFECCQCLMLLQNNCDVFIVTATLLSKHSHACQSYCGCAVVFQNNDEIDKTDLNSLHRLMGSQIMLSVG